MKSLSCIFVIMLGLSLCYGIGDVIPKFQCVDTVDPYVWVYWAIENCDNNSVTYHYTLSSGAGATLESGTKTAVAGWNTGANGFWVPKYTSFHYAPTPWTLSTYGPSGVVYSSSWNGCLEPGASSSTCGYPAGNECYLDGRILIHLHALRILRLLLHHNRQLLHHHRSHVLELAHAIVHLKRDHSGKY